MVTGEAYDLQSYVANLRDRIGRLEMSFAQIVSGEHIREERLEEAHASMARMVRDLDEELVTVEQRLRAVMAETTKLVGAFKDSGRQREFERLKQRVDLWKGEQYITRKEFKQRLKES